MDFMKCEWKDAEAHVTLVVKDYPQEGVMLEDLKPMIQDIRDNATDMIIKADLAGAGIVNIDRFRMIVSIVREVVDYTREDNLLRQIQFVNTGFIFRALYGPISLAIPKYFRDMVVFL
jgi:hypothetical protein